MVNKVKWTDEQLQAITAQAPEILVAAAAGSGKTAVLVERVIQRIIAGQDALNVDQLLVVTFTKAAAAEMRERIGRRLQEESQKTQNSKDKRRIQEQLLLLSKASISTLHSFCQMVIQRYYYLIDIDPLARIANDTEIALLRDQVLEEVLEQEYSNDSAQSGVFFQLADSYADDRHDDSLQEIIIKMYNFAVTHPEPKLWLTSVKKAYDIADVQELDNSPWISGILQDITLELQGIAAQIKQASLLIKQEPELDYYQPTLAQDAEQVQSLIVHSQANSWQKFVDALQNIAFANLPRKTVDPSLSELREKIKTMRTKSKTALTNLKKKLVEKDIKQQLQELQQQKPLVECLIAIVEKFMQEFQLQKRQKALLDFSDLEHYCLEILRLPDSPAPQQLQKRYKEVLVDEYQDTNLVQETIIKFLRAADNSLFMVGDVKQSIYRFRLAEPELFMEKQQRYLNKDQTGLRIDLSKNFRSNQQIIEAINFLFEKLMDSSYAEIAYDEAARLVCGQDSKSGPNEQSAQDKTEQQTNDSLTEILLIDSAELVDQELSELKNAQLEARAIAQEIKIILQQKNVKGEKWSYKDISILLRSASTQAPLIIEELKKFNIPAHTEITSGYFVAMEVQTMVSLLQILDNPCQDIALATVLRSPIVGLTGEQLAQIRVNAPDTEYFFEAVLAYPAEKISELDRFLQQLQKWRLLATQLRLSVLVWQLLTETGYYDYVGGLPAGNQRQANLRALHDRARTYDQTSMRGLFRFLRFIERLRKRGDDLGTARAVSEQEDVVRIMTIHKSKGLQFPIIFVAGLGKGFNEQDLKAKYQLHKKWGFASTYINRELSYRSSTILQQAIKQRIKKEQRAEELRVLYVALTRAEHKLTLVATVKKAEELLELWRETATQLVDNPENGCAVVPEYIRASAKSFIDWIGVAAVSSNSPWQLRLLTDTELTITNRTDVKRVHNSEQLLAYAQQQVAAETQQLTEFIAQQFNYSYPWQASTQMYAKQTVSNLIKQTSGQTKTYKKVIISNKEINTGENAAERGNVMHLAMQHLDFQRTYTLDLLEEQLALLVTREIITEQQLPMIDASHILNFMQSELGKRLRQAKKVWRELAFSYADRDSDSKELVVVQGIIDCVFADEYGLLLLDYKTDRNSNESEQVLIARHRPQIAYYSKALSGIWKININQAWVVYLHSNKQLLVL